VLVLKALGEAFFSLDTSMGIVLIVAAVGFVTLIALLVMLISFRAGRRYERARLNHYTTKRRELASITG
jgi:membrane protein DedA with SNARE-associated domain